MNVMERDVTCGAKRFSDGQLCPKVSVGNIVERQHGRQGANAAEGEQTLHKADAVFGHGAEIKCWQSCVNVLPLHEPSTEKKEHPLPGPLLHKCVEEREMERRTTGFMSSMREWFRGNLSRIEAEALDAGRQDRRAD